VINTSKVRQENLKNLQVYNFEELLLDERMILEWMLKIHEIRWVWIGFMYFRIRHNLGLLGTW
jgi:hypothetical protein